MKLEIFTLCDHAADYSGKVCINGAFDRILAKEFPHTFPHLTVYARVRFEPIEEATHQVRISFMDEDGKAVIPPLVGQIGVRFGDNGRTQVMNLVLQTSNVKLPKPGEYRVDFAVGGIQLGSLPLYVDQIAKPEA